MRVPLEEAEATWRLYEEIAALDCFALDASASGSLSWRPLAAQNAPTGPDDGDTEEEELSLAVGRHHDAAVSGETRQDDALEATDSDSSRSSSSPKRCSSRSSVEAEQPRRRPTFGQRQRETLQQLRAEVAELEAELQRLRGSRRGRARQLAATEHVQQQSDVITDAVEAFWERLANRERIAKQRALEENRRLRELMAQNLKAAHGLQRLLQQHVQAEMAGLAMSRAQILQRLGVLDEGHTRGIYAFLSHSLDSKVSWLDDILTQSGLLGSMDPCLDIELRRGERPDDWFVEIKALRVLPFPAEAVHDAAHEAMAGPFIERANGATQTEEASLEEARAKFTLSVDLKHSKTTSSGWVVGRRGMNSFPNGDMRYTKVSSGWIIVEGLGPQSVELVDDGWGCLMPVPSSDMCVMIDVSHVRAVGPMASHLDRLVLRHVETAYAKIDEFWSEGMTIMDADSMEGLYDEIAAIDSVRNSEDISSLLRSVGAAEDADPSRDAWALSMEIPELHAAPQLPDQLSPSASASCVSSKKLTSRQRQREEMRALREEVESLEAELARLRDSRRAQSPTSTSVDPVLAQSLMAFWKRRAAREGEFRQQAVQENSRLRDAFARNLRVARSLERLIQQHAQFKVTDRSLRDTQLLYRLNLLDDGYTRGIYTYLSARNAAWTGMTSEDGDLLYGRFQAEDIQPEEVKSRVAISLSLDGSAISFHGWLVGRRVDRYCDAMATHGYVWGGWIIVEGMAQGVLELVEDGWSRLVSLSPDVEMCVMQDLSQIRCVTTGDESIQETVLALMQAVAAQISECWNEKWERILITSRRPPASRLSNLD
ncbi:hypothetical protein ATCC90586_008164 [Pythium insidiosum]|nr:hypothetical protein ATCC90586_008164 [Pythium insidiosum]